MSNIKYQLALKLDVDRVLLDIL